MRITRKHLAGIAAAGVLVLGALIATHPGGSGSAQCVAGVMPDHACTPGASDPLVTQATIYRTICSSGYTATVRPLTSVTSRIKAERMKAYRLAGHSAADFELDHLIPLELGGAPADVANLWPEPWNGPNSAHRKDATENVAKAAVCAGTMPLADAQQAIATDWTTLAQRLGIP